ncbi:hypothetical protein [Streptomonospora salina]|uniref:Serine/threonine protein kinase n=1 Tax=Streptomonospora salina TaxID=104205 RepID=A0A841E945_9ACTN|nr:hypothetical protein [Streptomonospora salina]MBB5997040.1 serine/threonine protein kinase [Streptomonospora salina]
MPTEPPREQPTRVGERYELTSPISTGGMGQVWRGYDTVLDREIAVKLIRPDLTAENGPDAPMAGEAAELLDRIRRASG